LEERLPLADRISYDPEKDRADKQKHALTGDPRVALVRFMARGAAEDDFKKQLARWKKEHNQPKREPT
jgi:hypothetical protein